MSNVSPVELSFAQRRLAAAPEFTGELVTAVAAVLRDKGDYVFSVSRATRVLEAVRLMNVLEIGSVLVVEGRDVVGILSDRDVLNRVVAERRDPETVCVDEVMTTALPAVGERTSIAEAMWLMTERRRRHLPVLGDDDRVVGVISIGDLTKWVIQDKDARIQDLLGYITRP